MRKEKKLNPVKNLAKKTALRTAYQAQAHAKQAGQEIRDGATGEGPSDNYAQQKVEDKATTPTPRFTGMIRLRVSSSGACRDTDNVNCN